MLNRRREACKTKREEDENIAEWDNVQAMMDADMSKLTRLQAEEQGELTIEEKSKIMLFDKEMKRVNTFVDMDTELVKGSETRTEGSSKKAGEELESENLKIF
ncbi:hypothetical protein Tco_1047318 [Tanacetum coccineum]